MGPIWSESKVATIQVVDSIYKTYLEPHNRLIQILIAFTKQVNPRPTWRAVVDALRSPAVNLPQLAMRMEAAHCPDPTSTLNASLPRLLPNW